MLLIAAAAAIVVGSITPAATVRFRHVGCFHDKPLRDLPHAVHVTAALTALPAKCARECSAASYAFAGVQHGDSCFCGDSFGRHGAATASLCATPCSDVHKLTAGGDKDGGCGGVWANDVYSLIDEQLTRSLPTRLPFIMPAAAQGILSRSPVIPTNLIIHLGSPTTPSSPSPPLTLRVALFALPGKRRVVERVLTLAESGLLTASHVERVIPGVGILFSDPSLPGGRSVPLHASHIVLLAGGETAKKAASSPDLPRRRGSHQPTFPQLHARGTVSLLRHGAECLVVRDAPWVNNDTNSCRDTRKRSSNEHSEVLPLTSGTRLFISFGRERTHHLDDAHVDDVVGIAVGAQSERTLAAIEKKGGAASSSSSSSSPWLAVKRVVLEPAESAGSANERGGGHAAEQQYGTSHGSR
jgi:hypothetical protein